MRRVISTIKSLLILTQHKNKYQDSFDPSYVCVFFGVLADFFLLKLLDFPNNAVNYKGITSGQLESSMYPHDRLYLKMITILA